MVPKIRVLCIDHHAGALRAAIEREPDMEWAGWFLTAERLTEAAEKARADIALVNIDTPGPDPLSSVSEMNDMRPETRSIMLCGMLREHQVESSVASGAWGCISTGQRVEDIIEAIRTVASGKHAFPEEMIEGCEFVEGRLSVKRAPASVVGDLTDLELSVLRMTAEGAPLKKIALHIGQKEKRVEAIRHAVMQKIGCVDRIDVTRFAIREGLVGA